MQQLEADVAIVGAGLAGLSAARAVRAAGLEPVVVEARGRVGGRTVNEPIGDGKVVELGGQWIGPTHRRISSLAAELGIGSFPTYDRGARVLELGHRIRRYGGQIPPVSPRALLDLGWARARLDRLARTVPAHAPWGAPRARELDGQTLGTWLAGNVRTSEARALLGVAIASIWSAEPHEVNLLQALAYISAVGSFEALAGVRGGLQQDRVVGGSARIAQQLALELDGRVLLDRPIETVADTGAAVELRGPGACVRARRVIVAIAPASATRLRFEPALPPARDQALQRLPMAAVVKVAAVYERPFWRRHGLSGQAITERGPVASTFDNSPPDASPGVLIGFVPGARARAFARMPSGERRNAVLDTFGRLFGPDARRPERYIEKDWAADPWTRGCYFGLAAPGALTGVLRELADPIGRVHWAGAETARESYGGMDGAVISGERAAAEVIAALTAPRRAGPLGGAGHSSRPTTKGVA